MQQRIPNIRLSRKKEAVKRKKSKLNLLVSVLILAFALAVLFLNVAKAEKFYSVGNIPNATQTDS